MGHFLQTEQDKAHVLLVSMGTAGEKAGAISLTAWTSAAGEHLCEVKWAQDHDADMKDRNRSNQE